MGDTVIYTKIMSWVQVYGSAGIPDQRAVQDFMECETSEAVRGLQGELQSLLNGNYNPESIDRLLGPNRKVKHGSYEAWAKLMLLWISGYKA